MNEGSSFRGSWKESPSARAQRAGRGTGRGTLLLAALAGLVAAACGSNSKEADSSSQADPCHDADIAASRTWNEETRIKVQGRVMEWGGELGVDVAQAKAEEITNTMDRLTDDWARMRKAVCMDHFVRGTLDASEYQRRADCLDRLLTRQRTFLTSLESPEADVSATLTAIDEELATCR